MSEPLTKLPPFSEEAERAVIGSVLLDPERSIRFLRGDLKLATEEVYTPSLRVLLEQCYAMADARRPIDLMLLQQWLKDRNLLENVGGESEIEQIVTDTPTSAHLEHYAALVREKASVRRIIAACRETLERCAYGAETAQGILSHAMADLQGVSDDVMDRPRSNAEVFESIFATWKRAKDTRENGGNFLPGLKTPFRRYNEIMGGLQPGLHFFGGKSSAGKTSFVLNMTREFLLNNEPVLMIQLDDTHEDVLGRLTSMMAGVSLPALSQGFAKGDAMAKIEAEIQPLMSVIPLHVIEECADVRHAADMARYYKARFGIKLLIIDYVQVLDADGNARDDERIRLGKIANALKRLWKELRIPVVVVSQTSKFKDAEDDGRRADMSDLFGASELFHAATSVCIMKAVREKVDHQMVPLEIPLDATGHTKKHAVAGHIVKNKHGPKDCMVQFWALLKYFQFEETPMIHTGGIDRQQTWEECMADARGHAAAVAQMEKSKPAWAK